ncbi:MAG TPA: GNAT family N-acetyltransferase, partial [Pyrinomonadaceae bacterium]|nr:GNAT family N-acetyltransferase [Pyrinomonadaceae bacterium]
KYSPGTFLLTRMIEDFCLEGLDKIDFGLGDALYKERFGNIEFQEAPVNIFAPQPKGFALKAVHIATATADLVLRRILERTKLLPKIKKLWRNRLSAGSPNRLREESRVE